MPIAMLLATLGFSATTSTLATGGAWYFWRSGERRFTVFVVVVVVVVTDFARLGGRHGRVMVVEVASGAEGGG
jgi:hypothetical protein